MGNVIPLRRAASNAQCKRLDTAEDLVSAQVHWWFAVIRDFNRFWWGA